MSEVAYSLEMHKNMSAKEAVRWSVAHKLSDKRAFRCSCSTCGIPLTCTNWNNSKGTRFFFVPSHNMERHVIGCDAVDNAEKKENVQTEVKRIISSVNNNGIIVMMKSPDRKSIKSGEDQENNPSEPGGIRRVYRKPVDNIGTRSERSHIACMESIVEVFKRNDVDKDKRIISLDDELYSLRELFCDCSTDQYTDGETRIFYGYASVENDRHNSDLIKIVFDVGLYNPLYTNKGKIDKLGKGTIIKRLIGSNNKVKVYFRGSYNQNSKRFVSYNDKFFKDIFVDVKDIQVRDL